MVRPPPQGSPPAPPPPTPVAPRPLAKKEVKVQVNVVVLGNVDQRQLGLAMSRLRRELGRTFGQNGFELTLKSGLDSNPSREPRVFTLYLAAGDTPPTAADGRSLWELHGYKPGAEALKGLETVFAGPTDVKGLTMLHVSIIPADQVFAPPSEPETFLLSNVLTHELGHGLVGTTCAGHPNAPACGGVMQRVQPRSEDQGYTAEFIEIVKARFPLLVTEAPRYAAVWQPDTTEEIQLYNWPTEALRAKYDELWPQGWRLKLLSPYVVNNEVRYVAVFRPGIEGEIQVYDAPYAEYRAIYDSLWPQGWRLKLLSPYVVNNGVRYTAVWQPGTEGEIQAYGVTFPAFQARYDRLWQEGWRLKLLSPYVVNNEVRYTAVWQPGTEGEIQLYHWTAEALRAKYDELWPQGWRLKLLSPYVVNGDPRYIAVFQPGGQDEIQVYDWTYEDYRAEYDKLWDQGWRLKLLSPF